MRTATPIVIDLGYTEKEHIHQLRAGAGPLVEEVAEVMRRIEARVGIECGDRIFLPVVALCAGSGRDRKRKV